MDSEPDHELEVIKGQLDQTKSSLAEKIGALETQVSETVAGVTGAVQSVTDTVTGVTEKVTGAVQSVSDTVSGTVSNLTSAVGSTVDSVKHSLDFTPTIQASPWTSVGCAVAVGFLGGYLLGGSRTNRPSLAGQMFGFGRAEGAPPPAEPRSSYFYSPPAPAAQQPRDTAGTAVGALTDTFGDITGALQSYGISAVMGIVSNLVKDALPETVQPDVIGAIDKLKTRLGGRHSVNADFLTKP